jgi:hypothetical protein
VLQTDAAAHHDEQHRRGDDVHGRGRERDSPDAEPVVDGVEQGVEGDGAERDRRRHPVRLHRIEAAVEDQHPAVEHEPDREGLEALGDDDRVLGGELATLVDELDDRLRQHDRDERCGNEQERDLPDPRVERPSQPGVVAAGRKASERREENGRNRDREDALREHVQAEGGSDRRRRELGVEQARREQRVDEEVHVDEADRERDRQHQHEDALDRGVAPVENRRQSPVEASQPRDRQEELEERAEYDDAGVEVQLRALVLDPRNP